MHVVQIYMEFLHLFSDFPQPPTPTSPTVRGTSVYSNGESLRFSCATLRQRFYHELFYKNCLTLTPGLVKTLCLKKLCRLIYIILIHMHTEIYMHTHTHTYMHTDTQTCIHAYMHASIEKKIHAYRLYIHATYVYIKH